jgi:hypothetical protein
VGRFVHSYVYKLPDGNCSYGQRINLGDIMAKRKPLVLGAEGRLAELTVGDSLDGVTTAAGSFIHSQATAATTWNVLHNLDNENLLIQCWDASGSAIAFSTAVISDSNTLTLTFSSAQSGKAVITPTEQSGQSTGDGDPAGDYIERWTLNDLTGVSEYGTSDGTPSGGGSPAIVPGKVNTAMLFEGLAYFDIPKNSTIDVTGNFTITCWVNADDTSAAIDWIVTRTGTAQNGYAIYRQGATIRGGLKTDTGSWAGVTSSTITAETWYFVTLTWNGSQVELFLDGVSQGTAPTTGTLSAPYDRNMRIGCDSGSWDSLWEGEIDDIRLYDRVLTNQEISDLFTWEGVSSVPTDYVERWTFDDDTGASETGTSDGTWASSPRMTRPT